MRIELLYAPSCKQCVAARTELNAAVEQACVNIPLEWTELNVLEHLDFAVDLGVLTLPAVAIDGERVFTSLPVPRELMDELGRRNRRKPE